MSAIISDRLGRPCIRCGKRMIPTGVSHKICENCNKTNIRRKKIKNQKIKEREDESKENKKKDRAIERLKKKYYDKKIEIDKLRDNLTLENWKILSEAYKLGKKIWGTNFTVALLSTDMEMPYTTTKRCLSLDRATKKSWKLVEEGKLSVFKLAMICCLKNRTFQDKIVKMVIESNLSTYDITKLKINDIDDINKERHRLAVELGYSRKDSAYMNFSRWIERGKLFLLMDKEYLPETKIKLIKDDLKELNKMVDIYLK